MKWLFSISLFFCLCIACSPELPDGDKIVKEIYDQRVSDYMSQQLSDCKNKAIEDAESKVDSIIHGMLSVSLVDSLDFPTKPVRPVSPEHIIGTVDRFEVKNKENTLKEQN